MDQNDEAGRYTHKSKKINRKTANTAFAHWEGNSMEQSLYESALKSAIKGQARQCTATMEKKRDRIQPVDKKSRKAWRKHTIEALQGTGILIGVLYKTKYVEVIALLIPQDDGKHFELTVVDLDLKHCDMQVKIPILTVTEHYLVSTLQSRKTTRLDGIKEDILILIHLAIAAQTKIITHDGDTIECYIKDYGLVVLKVDSDMYVPLTFIPLSAMQHSRHKHKMDKLEPDGLSMIVTEGYD